MPFLAIEKELKNIPEFQRDSILKEEAKTVLSLCSEGTIKEIYFNEHHLAVIFFDVAVIDQVNIAIASLPLVQEGFITFDVMELKPYTGFSRLQQ